MSPPLTLARDGVLTVHRTELAPDVDPLALWATSSDEHRCYFARDGFAVVGLGAAAMLEGRPGQPLSSLAAARDALASQLDIAGGAHPLLLGGASFGTTGRGRGPGWSAFPDSRFLLPEVLVVKRAGRVWAVTVGAELPRDFGAGEPISAAPLAGLPAIDADHDDDYVDLVRSAVSDICSSTELDKVVVSRCLHVGDPEPYAGTPTEHAAVLARLRRRYPDCTTFGLAFGDETFFGATPERLVSRHKGRVRTMAVAGSIARGADPEADAAQVEALRQSPKNLGEHRFVVDHIGDALRSLGLDPQIPGNPEVVKLRNIAHLYTPIEAEGRPGSDVLEVAAALHPTPAVAGTPTPNAVEWIDRHERFDRGWFAAPIGWLDLAGDGELRVGLRSALLDSAGLHLFAGAGIVADSDPHHELAETAVKLGALVDSLTG